MLTSKIFKQQYGYFEIRSKMPNSTGTWPAFWLTGTQSWPPEIDIYEWYGGKTKKVLIQLFTGE
jgi:Beta-glucanase/Beta-glucan synthetase